MAAGDNIFQYDCDDAVASLNMAFAPAIEAKIPWAAVLGNHDQEGNLSRQGVMRYITSMDYTVSGLNPSRHGCNYLDGFGNNVLEILGAPDSPQQNKSVMNLYFVDSGDYSLIPEVAGYGWIHETQSTWVRRIAKHLQVSLTFTSVSNQKEITSEGTFFSNPTNMQTFNERASKSEYTHLFRPFSINAYQSVLKLKVSKC